MRGKVKAVCVSAQKGVKKNPVGEISLEANYGVKGDAHAQYDSIRQVSLLATESIEKIKALGLEVGPGDFAENITISGVDLPSLKVGTLLKIGEAIGEVSQIGKECHDRCNIYKTVGDCVMPREGIFIKVVRSGKVTPGDELIVLEGKEVE